MRVRCLLLLQTLVAGLQLARGSPCSANGPRQDCGYVGIDQQGCEAKGCCWLPIEDHQAQPHVDQPWCVFKNAGRSDYVLTSSQGEGNHLTGSLASVNQTARELGPDIKTLRLAVEPAAAKVLHVKLSDPGKERWEVPTSIFPYGSPGTGFASSSESELRFAYTKEPFSFNITRRIASDNAVPLFSTAGLRLVFKDQYLELSTHVPASSTLFGLNERTNSRGLALPRDGLPLTLWNRDTGALFADQNLYGSHPFVMEVREDGSTHGLLLLNSNGMDVVVTPERLSFRVIGGLLDLYFLAGPTPGAVMEQLTGLVGRPAMPPYWSLGFHQCRWGYKKLDDLREVVDGYAKAAIPLDTIWSDIDHMDAYRDFTFDSANFPVPEMSKFVAELHARNQSWVPIVDPGIKIDPGYAPYDEGLKEDIFLTDAAGKPYMGQVWPGAVHYPDFSNPKTHAYWKRQISAFHKMAAFDGLWIDMNEASNFCTGDVCEQPMGVGGAVEGLSSSLQQALSAPVHNRSALYNSACFLQCTSADSFNATLSPSLAAQLNNPPYAIANGNAHEPLEKHAIPVTVMHADGTVQYNTHNLYGVTEALATHAALVNITGRRPFILTRSSFLGTGAVAAHWTGDNAATWDDLRWSISSVLSSGLVGIPFVGADICGFSGQTTEELCARWISAGAFYPFSRDHSASQPQELYLWEQTAKAGRKALGLRYQLLPYLYTAFHQSSRHGCPVARPLFYAWPADAETHGVHEQWLLGDGILVSPVLQEGADEVEAYLPAGKWYSLWDHSAIDHSAGGKHVTLDAPLGDVPVHALGGTVLPMQAPALTAAAVRDSPLSLLVALPALSQATKPVTPLQPASAMHRHLLSGAGHQPDHERRAAEPAGKGPLRCAEDTHWSCGESGPGRATACGHMFLDTDANLQGHAVLGNGLHFLAELKRDESNGFAGQLLATFSPGTHGDQQQGCADVAWMPLNEVTVLGHDAPVDPASVTMEVWEPAGEGAAHTLGRLLSSTVVAAHQVHFDAALQRLHLSGLNHQLRCPQSVRITWQSGMVAVAAA